jgi:CubicO group peptidase (beta-lactamase class C family)
LNLGELPYLKSVLNPLKSRSTTHRTMMNPRVLTNHNNFNRRDVRSVEIPSANGIGQVRSIAKAYSVFAAGGEELGLEEDTLQALTMPAMPPSSGLRDEVLQVDMLYSLGFTRPLRDRRFGIGARAFGFGGAGGSFAFADPDAQVGYAYAPNKMGLYAFDDPREKALRDAFYRCLTRLA